MICKCARILVLCMLLVGMTYCHTQIEWRHYKCYYCSYTCAIPAMTSWNICRERGPVKNTYLSMGMLCLTAGHNPGTVEFPICCEILFLQNIHRVYICTYIHMYIVVLWFRLCQFIKYDKISLMSLLLLFLLVLLTFIKNKSCNWLAW